MPITKLYSIVTNDEYEFPVVCDIAGKQAAADYLGISITTFFRNIKSGKWKGNHKAIEVGQLSDLGNEFQPNDLIKPLDKKQKEEKQKKLKQDREKLAKEKEKEYNRKYYEKNGNRVLEIMKEYYKQNSERICEYGKRYRREIKEGERICFARSK